MRQFIRTCLCGHLHEDHRRLLRELEQVKLMIGKQEAERVRTLRIKRLQDAEFHVFSQFGEDGIIQYLISHVPIQHHTCVELGVGNYEESNTRFLLMNNNWKGLIVNADTEHITYVKSEQSGNLRYRHHLEAVSSFITKEHVNTLLEKYGIRGDIGLLSLDIDGVDYWVFEAIQSISPRIVVLEYNSVFGDTHMITVPYKKDFDRRKEHHSLLYFGASLPALVHLAKKKGYVFVGSNSAGNNAFFVRKDVARGLPHLSAKQGYVENLYRESSDEQGNLTYVSEKKEQRKIIENCLVYNVLLKKTVLYKKFL